MQIKFEIQGLQASVKKKGKYYISCCQPLDVCSQGETKKEALTLFLIVCFEKGTLNKVLNDCGFVHTDKQKKLPPGYESIDIDLPLPFQIPQKDKSNLCHA